MRPEASVRAYASQRSARTQSPLRSWPRSATVSGAGEDAPGGRQVSQTVPPSGIENDPCGPCAPQTAQSKQDGAQPARARARSV